METGTQWACVKGAGAMEEMQLLREVTPRQRGIEGIIISFLSSPFHLSTCVSHGLIPPGSQLTGNAEIHSLQRSGPLCYEPHRGE